MRAIGYLRERFAAVFFAVDFLPADFLPLVFFFGVLDVAPRSDTSALPTGEPRPVHGSQPGPAL